MATKEYNRKYRERTREAFNEYMKKYYQENKDRISKYYKEYREKNKEALKDYRQRHRTRAMLIAAKKRAKKNGLEFDLTLADIAIPEYCPVLGLPLRWNIGTREDNSPSIDRLNPDRGYTKDNIVIISWRANNLKSNGKLEEFEKLISFLKAQQ